MHRYMVPGQACEVTSSCWIAFQQAICHVFYTSKFREYMSIPCCSDTNQESVTLSPKQTCSAQCCLRETAKVIVRYYYAIASFKDFFY